MLCGLLAQRVHRAPRVQASEALLSRQPNWVRWASQHLSLFPCKRWVCALVAPSAANLSLYVIMLSHLVIKCLPFKLPSLSLPPSHTHALYVFGVCCAGRRGAARRGTWRSKVALWSRGGWEWLHGGHVDGMSHVARTDACDILQGAISPCMSLYVQVAANVWGVEFDDSEWNERWQRLVEKSGWSFERSVERGIAMASLMGRLSRAASEVPWIPIARCCSVLLVVHSLVCVYVLVELLVADCAPTLAPSGSLGFWCVRPPWLIRWMLLALMIAVRAGCGDNCGGAVPAP